MEDIFNLIKFAEIKDGVFQSNYHGDRLAETGLPV
jgi:hypothetical protein